MPSRYVLLDHKIDRVFGILNQWCVDITNGVKAQHDLQGTSTKLEKSYFRLTSAPDPATVRPEPVLRKALARLVQRIAAKEVTYFYAQDQFKGLRQDCVIQAIRKPLTTAVYEAHARAALEYGDLAEYNQCQGQLKVLYAEGATDKDSGISEFIAYRILYQTVHVRHGEGLALLHTLRRDVVSNFSSALKIGLHCSKGCIGLSQTRSKFLHPQSSLDVRDGCAPPPREIVHALQVRYALGKSDYISFFKLYATAPNLGRALMDLAVPRVRYAALVNFVKSFKPTLEVEFVARVLGFTVVPHQSEVGGESEGGSVVGERGMGQGGDIDGVWGGVGGEYDMIKKGPMPGCSEVVFEGEHPACKDIEKGVEACIAWLEDCGAVLVSPPASAGGAAAPLIDCKASTGRLRMPESKEKVAHGDANLDIGDFLKDS